MILRDLAITWVEACCPRIDVQRDFIRRVDEALQRGVGCSCLVGAKLTRNGQRYLIHCFCGEFFAFHLSQRQARQMKVVDSHLVVTDTHRRHNHDPHPEPPVSLEQVEVDNAGAIDRTKPITGKLVYQTDQRWKVPLVLQVACEPPAAASMLLFHYLDYLMPGSDTISFSLSAFGNLRNSKGQPYVGIVPLFFRLGVYSKSGNGSTFGSVMPVTNLAQLMPFGDNQNMQTPEFDERLGEHFIFPTPMPALISPEMIYSPIHLGLRLPLDLPGQIRVRSISDICAVMVEVN